MNYVLRSLLLLLVVMLTLTSCVSSKEGDLLRQDIITLKTQLESLKQSVTETDRSFASKQDEIRVDLDKAMHRNLETTASDHVELDRIRRDIVMLNGMIEKNGFDIGQQKMKLGETIDALELRVAVLEAKLGITPGKTPDTGQSPAIVPTTPVKAITDDPETLYKQAKKLVKDDKNTVEGRRLLALFLKKYKKHALADNAQYWIGESFYIERNYHQAVMEFNKVVDHYKKTDSVDDALYMLGECFRSLGMKEDARLFYDECIARFPDTRSARKCREALKKI